MFFYQANSLKTLSNLLCSLLEINPPSAFEAEVIVVQHHGMAQWLQKEIAMNNGICAHVNFPLPARFFGEISRSFIDPEGGLSLPDQQQMMWQIFTCLPEFIRQNDHQELSRYLIDTGEEIKQYQLARTISSLFDKYSVYRPDMLARWTRGKDQHWQAELWRFLRDRYQYQETTFAHFLQLLKANPQPVEPLARRCFLFGINSMVPVYLDLLNHLDHYMELHLFHLSPCQEYWGDIRSEKEQAHNRTYQHRNQYTSSGNPLLSSWGALGRDFLEQLMAYDVTPHENYTLSSKISVLNSLQDDILTLSQGKESEQIFRADQSLQVHNCHAPLREIQVLHDRLMNILEDNPELTAGDILVTAPDISVYNGLIQGVFESAPNNQRLPYHLADRPLALENSTVKGFLEILQILTGRATAPEVYALLENTSLAAHFDIRDHDMARLQFLLEATAIRWGLDSNHRAAYGFQDFKENTWEFGLDQLLLGHIMGKSDEPFHDIYPYGEISNADENLLGSLCSLIDQLQSWQKILARPHNCDQWPVILLDLLRSFFTLGDDETGFQTVTEILLDWEAQILQAEISSPLAAKTAIEYITTQLSEQQTPLPFLTGRITFCNMVPMRAVPFKVICILGMDDASFPRGQRPVSFDLTLKDPRIGDRDRRSDDRYLFLEMVLSAEKVLYLSWTGQSQHDDSYTPPSIVISEILEYLNLKHPKEEIQPAEQLVSNHPLQAFSQRYFHHHSSLQSYAHHLMPSVNKQKTSSFLAAPLQPVDEENLDISTLVSFWRHPCQFFLKQQLGVQLSEYSSTLEDHEPFALNSLDQFYLRQYLIESALSHHEKKAINKLSASGLIPKGYFGTMMLEELTAESENFSHRLHTACTEKIKPIEFNLEIDALHISGRINNLYSSGRITWRSSNIKGMTLMELWLYHLVLCILAPDTIDVTTCHFSRNQRIDLIQVAEPQRYFRQLLTLYLQGQRSPLHFFPESAYQYATAKPETKRKKAMDQWLGSSWQHGPRGEYNDPVYEKLFPDVPEQALNDEFVSLSEGVFVPILNHLVIDDAAS